MADDVRLTYFSNIIGSVEYEGILYCLYVTNVGHPCIGVAKDEGYILAFSLPYSRDVKEFIDG